MVMCVPRNNSSNNFNSSCNNSNCSSHLRYKWSELEAGRDHAAEGHVNGEDLSSEASRDPDTEIEEIGQGLEKDSKGTDQGNDTENWRGTENEEHTKAAEEVPTEGLEAGRETEEDPAAGLEIDTGQETTETAENTATDSMTDLQEVMISTE
eukprot:CAMPEP_0168553400 /NCGR_PEP_ID=MMETSP0413-20121227/7232_1 /TAXON_ID=136452 /ORGANISM="Filamoeba nolandi, Strain NC-AS-23-1" /LENGTH=151 /DNA_ID=CAMNT_0008584083 /DNA_START=74 /DNA_END=526 /DNA_ORIENTATION=-